MKIQKVMAAAALTSALAACSDSGSGAESAAEPAPAEETSAAPAVFDEAEVIDHLGVEVRPDGDDVPPDFLIDDSYVADYRWVSQDGEVCFLSNMITSAGEADMAGPSAVLNPQGSAGVEFYADTENLATCSELLRDELASFPS